MLLAVFSLLFIIKKTFLPFTKYLFQSFLYCALWCWDLEVREADKTDQCMGRRKVFTVDIGYRIVRGLWEILKKSRQCLWGREGRGRLSNARATSLWNRETSRSRETSWVIQKSSSCRGEEGILWTEQFGRDQGAHRLAVATHCKYFEPDASSTRGRGDWVVALAGR